MKTVVVLKHSFVKCLIVCFGLCAIGLQPLAAQDVDEMEKSLKSIGTDLQEKTLKFSWELTEAYLNYCQNTERSINVYSEPYLKSLATYNQLPELALSLQTMKDAQKELESYLLTFKEYAKIDSLRRNASSEVDQNNVNAANKTFRNWLFNNHNEKFHKLNNTATSARKQYYFEVTRYAFNQFKSSGRVMPTSFIPHEDRQYLLSNDATLKLLSEEVKQLEMLQSRLMREYQKLKYNLPDQEPMPSYR
ncbi:DUF5039 family protein [Bacteroides sp. 51]|uniref:DUF5039 family protein n=1 Tax=Bacteroides sp. 51 TaxID=2302938 RepID=UPI0013CFB842|nr:DUF5039 family protein [Bacteroides sp. 51]